MAILGNVPKKEKHKRIPKEDVNLLDYTALLKGVFNKFVIAYGPLVAIWEEDLMQEGQIGLMKALDKYDPKKGTFVTIAWLKVHTAMTRKLNCKGGILQVLKHEISFEDMGNKNWSRSGGSASGGMAEVSWEETFEGTPVNYDALVWHFTDPKDRKAAYCIFKYLSKKNRIKILGEPIEEADVRCERVFSEMLTLLNLWYGGVAKEYPTLEQFRAMKPTKYSKRSNKNG